MSELATWRLGIYGTRSDRSRQTLAAEKILGAQNAFRPDSL
jgi:hypothetical protein